MHKIRVCLRLLMASCLISNVGLLSVACNEKKTIDLATIKFSPLAFPVVNKQALQSNEIIAVENVVRQFVISTINQNIAHTTIHQDYQLDESIFATQTVANSIDVHVFGISEIVIGDNFVHVDFVNPFDLASIQFPVVDLPVLNNTYLTNEDVEWTKTIVKNLVAQRFNTSDYQFRLQLGADYQIDLCALVAGANLSSTNVKITSCSKLVKNDTSVTVDFVNPLDLTTINFPKLTFSVVNNFRVTQSEISDVRESIIKTVGSLINQIVSGLVNKVDYHIDLSPLQENVNLSDGIDLTISSCSVRTIASNSIHLDFVNSN